MGQVPYGIFSVGYEEVPRGEPQVVPDTGNILSGKFLAPLSITAPEVHPTTSFTSGHLSPKQSASIKFCHIDKTRSFLDIHYAWGKLVLSNKEVQLVHHYLLYLMCNAGSNPASLTTSESTEQEAGPSSCSAIIPKSWDHIRISEDPSLPWWLHQNYPVSHFISVASLLKRVECPLHLSNRNPQFLHAVLLDSLHKSWERRVQYPYSLPQVVKRQLEKLLHWIPFFNLFSVNLDPLLCWWSYEGLQRNLGLKM